MAISDKTRKTLWARSGNRCAICKIELVQKTDASTKNLNLGEECHIISSKKNGPRHFTDEDLNYDEYDNLILLSCNHHKTIDEQVEKYPYKNLKSIKSEHEQWIKEVIDNAGNKQLSPQFQLLVRVRTGKELFKIISNVHAYDFDNDELETPEEVEILSSFFQTLEDWIDLSGYKNIEKGQQIQIAFELNSEINKLEELGFLVFGVRFNSEMTNHDKKDLGIWDIARIRILRKTNPDIVDFSEK